MFQFDVDARRKGIGNMKGNMLAEIPEDSVMLWGAEMDYPTAPCVRCALTAFAENGLYGFTLSSDEYTGAIRRWMQKMRKAEIEEDWVIPTMGTVYSLCTAVRAFTKKGDGIIIQSPSYYRFDRAIERNERTVVYNPLICEDGCYSLDFDDLEMKMSQPRNRLMILVNPHNPTGKVFSEADLLRIRDIAKRNNVIVFSDEIFAETAQPGFETRPYAVMDEQGITSFSLGKSFNFTGVSQANLLIPNKDLREAYIAQRNREHYGSIDPFFYNAVLAAYSEDGAAWIHAMNAHTKENYELIRDTFAEEMPLLSISPLEGTFVAWIDCRKLGMNDDSLQYFFKNAAKIYADPGYEYGEGGSGRVR